MLNDWLWHTHTRNNRLFQFMSIMDKIWRRFAFYPICRSNPTTNQTTGLCCRCVSYNVCLPLSFFRDILPSPKHTQQQHTPYNLIQLFRSTLRPANAMWSLIKPQNVAVCELLKTIPFGGCQKIWRFVDVNASSCATRTNFCGVRFVLIDNCWNRSRLVFRARCHFAIMARRLGVLKQQQPLAVFVDLNLIMFPARESALEEWIKLSGEGVKRTKSNCRAGSSRGVE